MPFTDTFERADGSLGSNWQVQGTFTQIVGGRAKAVGGGGYAICLADSESGPQDASITYPNTVAADLANRVYVKATANASQYYAAYLGNTSNGVFCYILKSSISTTPMASASVQEALGTSVTLRLVYSAGWLFLYVNGVLHLSYADAAFGANAYTGFQTSSGDTGIDSFTTSGALATTFSVAPSSTQAGGPPIQVAFSGTGTTWTPGQPGSPIFTASAGTLSDQVVTSSTSARATFAPPLASQTVSITDSSTGLTDTIWCGTDLPAGGGEGFAPKLTDKGAALVNRSGEDRAGLLYATDSPLGITPIDMTMDEFLKYMYDFTSYMYGVGPPNPLGTDWLTLLANMARVLNGDQAPPTGPFTPSVNGTVQGKLDGLAARFGQYDTLNDVVAMLGGSPTVLSHQDLKTAIELVQGGADLQPILDYLSTMWGPLQPTLTDMDARVKGIVTVDNLSLRDVLQAIDLLPKSLDGGYTLADRTANAAGFVGVLLAISTLAAVEAEDAAASSGSLAGILALATELAGGVASILGVLESLKSLLGGGSNEYRVPVWPGQAHVTYGDYYDLATTTHVPGPMHGVELNITATEPKTLFYDYDGHTSWRHIGGLVFYNDAGKHETYQALAFAEAIFVPKTLAIAQGCRLFKNRLPRGTIRPWTINT